MTFGSNKSSPIDLTGDGKKLVVANIDTDTASFFDVADDGSLTKIVRGGHRATSRARSRRC